jgi:hypothetical protein
VWLAASNSEFDASTTDEIICAEISDVNIDPLGYTLVDEFMIRGPCGAYNRHFRVKPLQMNLDLQSIEDAMMVGMC